MSRVNKRGNGTVRVKKDKLALSLSCRICNDLFSDYATTISECLHAFCKKCIEEKIEEEENPHCPVCKVDLGPSPFDKLKPDHSLQALRTKLFPPTAVEHVASSDALSANASSPKPKERLHSSLDAPSPQSSTTNVPKTKDPKELEDSAEKNSGSAKTVSKATPAKGNQKLKNIDESSSKKVSDSIAEGKKPESENKTEQVKRSKRLVEAAKKKEAISTETNNEESKNNSQDSDADSISLAQLIGTMAVSKGKKRNKRSKKASSSGNKGKGSDESSQAQDIKESNDDDDNVIEPVLQAPISNQELPLDGLSSNPVWFSLVASNTVIEGYKKLPQVSSRFVRIKDGNMPAVTVKKYISKKLELPEDVEIELMLRDQPVISTMTLQNLMNIWIESAPSTEKIKATAGSSGEGVVMILNYFRKA